MARDETRLGFRRADEEQRPNLRECCETPFESWAIHERRQLTTGRFGVWRR